MLGVGWEHLLVLAVVALFVFGPERLPSLARDAGRVLRQLRQMSDDLRDEVGPELAGLRSLDPRRIVERYMLDDDEPDRPAGGQQTAAPRRLDKPATGQSGHSQTLYDDAT